MLLAVVMLLGALPVSAFAAEDESTDVLPDSVAESVDEEAAAGEEEEETPAEDEAETPADNEEETPADEEEDIPASGEDDAAADGGEEKDTSADQDAAQKVIGLIDAIGEVTLESEAAISEANGAYQLLTAEQKALVTNYDALVDAMAAYMMLSVAMPVEESAADAVISVTVNNKGVLAEADDGSVMANRPVTVKDLNADGVLTCGEALTAVHAAYCPGGYATSESVLGTQVDMLWGVEQSPNFYFVKNHAALTMNVGDTSSTVAQGDELYVSVLTDTQRGTDYYTYFTDTSLTVDAGSEFTLTLQGYPTLAANQTAGAVSGISVGTWDNGSFAAIEGKTTDGSGQVTLSFDQPGTYYVTADGDVPGQTVTDFKSEPDSDGNYPTVTVDCPIMAPVCVVTVEAAEVVPADPADITVTIVNKGNVVMARKSITVTDYDADGSLDVDDALYAAHAAAYPGGAAAGYSCYTGNYGLSLGTLWGDSSGCFGYRLNDGSCYSLADSVKAGDYLVAYVYQDQTGWSDTYARFGQSTYSATAGEALTVAVDQAAYDENWNDIFKGCDNVVLTAYDSSFTALSADIYRVDGFHVTFRNAGTYYLVASGTGGNILVPAVAVVTVEAAYAPLSVLKFTNGSKDTSTQYTMTPAFDPAVKEYTVTVPDSTSSVYAWATLAEGSSDAIKITYTKTNNAAASVTVTSGKTTGQSLSSAVASSKLTGNTLTVMVGDTAAYTINIVRQATLSKLVVTTADAKTVSFDKSFSATAAEYTAKIAHDAVLTVTPTVKTTGAAVQITGAAEDGTVKPVWTADRTFDLTVTVSGEGAVSSTYTIRCQQLATALEIQKAPAKTAYSAGETFDPTGMELKAAYADGGSKTIPPEEFTFAPAGSLGLGTTEVEVTYDGLSVVQPITIGAVFEGQGTEASPFLIKTTEDMVKLSELVAAGVSFSGEYLKMVNDITLPDTQGEDAWVPLGTGKAAPFSGNFDGNGKLLTVPEGGLPLIGFPKQATLKNLNIYGTKIAGYGVVNGYAQGDKVQAITIENVTLKSGTQTLQAGFIGGYASGTDTITIRNCTVEAGVVIGYDKQQTWIGSFGGEFNGTIENCVSYAAVYGTDFVGGIVADKGQSMGAFSVTGCEFHGTVEASGNYVGGIVGHGYGGTGWGFSNNAACVTIQNCKSTGSITGGNYVGGILGADAGVVQCWANGTGYIQNNQFTGQVKATAGEYVGGIIGYLKSLNRYNVIENNFYQHDCGAAKGIGWVAYVDTSCETHETASGATYFNTANGKPGITGVTKTDHNRTDDPLGADADKLTYTTHPAESAVVRMTVSNQGVLASCSDGSVMANKEVTVTDLNSDGVLTYDEALAAAHAAYCKDGYETAESQWGLSVTKLWGVTTGNTVFYQNHTALTSNVGDTTKSTVAAGDYLAASVNSDGTYYSDHYTYFSSLTAEATAKQAVSLTLNGTVGSGDKLTIGTWNNGTFTAIEDAKVAADGTVSLTFAEAGTYYVTASGTVHKTISDYTQTPDENWVYPTIEHDCPIIAPVCVVTVSPVTYPVTGTWGKNGVTWSLSRNGVLTVGGAGQVPMFSDRPWEDYASEIREVVIEDGVVINNEYAGWNAFAGYTDLTRATLGTGVTVIPTRMFHGCTSLSQVTISGAVTGIYDRAFADCASLKTITLPETLTHIAGGTLTAAFAGSGITAVNFRGAPVEWNNIQTTAGLEAVVAANRGTETAGDAIRIFYGVTVDPSLITRQPADTVYQQNGDASANPVTVSARALTEGETLRVDWYQTVDGTTGTGAKVSTGVSVEGAVGKLIPATGTVTSGNYFCIVRKTAADGSVTAAISNVVQVTVAEVGVFTGTGTTADPYLIHNLTDLQTLQTRVAEGTGYEGIHFLLTADIELPADWTGIGALVAGATGTGSGRNIRPFSGILDGGGKTVTVAEGGQPLFGYVREAVVQNLKIQGKYINGNGLIANYTVDYGADGNYNSGTGGSYAAGCPDIVTITNVTILSGTNIKGSGFLSGFASGGNVVTIQNCTAESGVKIGVNPDGTSAEGSKVGSFAGEFSGTISGSASSATVYGKDKVGGLAGSKSQSMGVCVVEDSEFHGSVIATGELVGGILGSGYTSTSAPNAPASSVTGCTVTGTVSGADKVGGIFGGEGGIEQTWSNGIGYVQNNEFTGTVSGTGENVGGIIGYMKSLNRYNIIENNYYKSGCGATKGIGGAAHIDTSKVQFGEKDGVLYYDTSTDSLAQIKKLVDGEDDPYTSVAKADHNRTDDPLGADAQNLTRTDVASAAVKLTVSGSYKTEYTVGEKLDLTGMVLTITYDDGSAKEVPVSEAEITGFDSKTPGEKTLLIKHSNLSTSIKVTVKKAAGTIDVTITVLGDSAHGGGGAVHTYAGGGLSTWVGAATYTVDSNATVWTVLKKCLDDHGLSYSKGSNYVVSINGLAEFTNGSNSGWMYTLNGGYPLLGVDEQHLEDGDVIVFHYTDDYTRERHGYTEEEDSTAVDVVEKLISNIGTVTLTTACKNKIDAARKAYGSLTFIEKKQVSNYAVLEAAEAAYAKLKKENDEKKATEVEQLINQIDSQITLNSEKAIKAARTAYDKLTADQKALVDNLYKLTNAERELAKLKATDEDKQKAQEVMDKIEELGEITLDSKQAIEAARAAYDKLTDIQKALVENYQILEDAEAKLALLQAAAVGEDIYKTTGDYMESLGTPAVGTVGGEWMVIGLARSGREIPDAYYDSVVAYVLENIDEQERLHTAKSTENSRLILALTAIGKDVTDVRGHNLLTGLNDMDYVRYQGINGPIWALMALDSGNYPAPEGNVTRESLLDVILDAQLEDGGWALSGEDADADMTGMALQALAPYCESRADVEKAVEKALETLSLMQNTDGSYSSVDGASSESIAQVIVGLTALGIDPDTDARFIKNGTSALDALLAYYVEGGGFKHILSGNRDGMATEQAYYALTAYYRMLSGETGLYDMTDMVDMGGDAAAEPVETTEPVPATEPVEEEPSGGFPWFLVVVILAAGAAAVVLVPVFKKKLFLK